MVINVYTVFNISSLGGVTGGYNAYYNCTTYLDNDNVFNELGHNVTTDPLISDVTPDDPEGFKINEGSPCMDAGINDDSDIPSEDYFGNTRIGGIDIGANEFT